MADDVYEGPVPGDLSVLSDQHGELVKGLYDLRGRLTRITSEEKRIVEAAIMMLEFLDEYAHDADDGESPPEVASSIRWDVDDFDRLICNGGFELHHGRLVPRL